MHAPSSSVSAAVRTGTTVPRGCSVRRGEKNLVWERGASPAKAVSEVKVGRREQESPSVHDPVRPGFNSLNQ